MSKYGSGLDTTDVCKLELDEMGEILAKYNVSKEDAKALEDMLIEAYFQLLQVARSGRVICDIFSEYADKEEMYMKYFEKMGEIDKYEDKFQREILDPREVDEEEWNEVK